MSINGSMLSGVSGLKANSTALAVISDNISNVNTVAYKRSRANFQTLVTTEARQGSYNSGGVLSTNHAFVSGQGLLQRTESSTDLGISGNGFFVVSEQGGTLTTGDARYFTRAGSFNVEKDGYLQNSAGFYLLGWELDEDGVVDIDPSSLTDLVPINVGNIGGTAEATTSVTFNANLQSSQTVSAEAATYDATDSTANMASGSVTPDFERSMEIIDSMGGKRTIYFSFLKTSTPNQWNAEVYVSPSTDIETGTGLVNGQIATGTVAFTSDGRLDTTNTTLPSSVTFLPSSTAAVTGSQIKWATAAGLSGQTLSMNIGSATSTSGLTQFDSPSNLLSTSSNGSTFGNLSNVEIDEEGYVTALFDNGESRQLYKVPVATFPSADNLTLQSGNVYGGSAQSGTFTLKEAGSAGAGAIAPATLEASTVDLSTEFTNMITVQRAYSAASKIITTSDEMMEELIRMKR